ncbi:MAG TPA: hypothetical protein VHA35_20575 [Dongiaceae bacterium]|nr:hypothetical protein [Dongiaceae bacterium]
MTGCGTEPGSRTIPLPLLPQVVDVPVLVRIPIGMTEPCPEPPRRPIATDVELLEAADAFKVAMRCNAAKLKAIEEAQGRPAGG